MATSYGRDVKFEGQEPNSLEQHPGVQRYFERASQNEPEQGLEADQEDARGSKMVEQDQPEPELKPDPELAADQDRETFNDKWASEQEDARRELLARYEAQVERDLPEPDHENSL